MLERIRESYPELSSSYQKIARYITENYREVAFLTAAKLAEQVNVSESVVVRFASRMGYDGYPEMQKIVQDMVRAEFSPSQRLDQKSHFGESGIFKAVTDRDRENIAKTEQNLRPVLIHSAARAILNSRHVWVIGAIESGSLARLYGLLLSYVVPNVTVLDRSGAEMAAPLKRVMPNDVVLGFSFARYAKHTTGALEYCRQRGATIIVITDSELSAVARLASIALVASVDMVSFFNSYTAVVMLMNILLGEIVEQAPEKVKEELKRLDEVMENFDYM